MDQEMPVMDGITCIRKIRARRETGEFNRHVPVIAVTANARSEQITVMMQAGMDLVITKPFRIPELVPQMWKLVERFTPADGSDGADGEASTSDSQGKDARPAITKTPTAVRVQTDMTRLSDASGKEPFDHQGTYDFW